jgi:hypothetical protein
MGGSKQRKREAAIAALLSSTTIEKAAEKVKISPRTLKRWLAEDKDFKARYEAERMRLVEGATNFLLRLNRRAAATLGKNLAAPKPADSTRAAKVILELSHRGLEFQQLAAEIAELKKIVGGIQKRDKLR